MVYISSLHKCKQPRAKCQVGWSLAKRQQESEPVLSSVNISFLLNYESIDPMQKWLPLNYSFVHIQNSLTNLIWDNKFFTIFVSKMRLVRLI